MQLKRRIRTSFLKAYLYRKRKWFMNNLSPWGTDSRRGQEAIGGASCQNTRDGKKHPAERERERASRREWTVHTVTQNEPHTEGIACILHRIEKNSTAWRTDKVCTFLRFCFHVFVWEINERETQMHKIHMHKYFCLCEDKRQHGVSLYQSNLCSGKCFSFDLSIEK